jgi:hypothetical protein
MGEVLAAFPEVRLALLFGSEARGTGTARFRRRRRG